MRPNHGTGLCCQVKTADATAMVIQPANDCALGSAVWALLEDSDLPLKNLRARLSLRGDCEFVASLGRKKGRFRPSWAA